MRRGKSNLQQVSSALLFGCGRGQTPCGISDISGEWTTLAEGVLETLCDAFLTAFALSCHHADILTCSVQFPENLTLRKIILTFRTGSKSNEKSHSVLLIHLFKGMFWHLMICNCAISRHLSKVYQKVYFFVLKGVHCWKIMKNISSARRRKTIRLLFRYTNSHNSLC